MAEEAYTAVKEYLDKTRAFEVKFEGDKITVCEAQGISKTSVSKSEMKGARVGGKRKIPKDQMDVLRNSVERLFRERVNFKVIFGKDDSTIRFDLDHYIHLYPDKCLVLGFRSLDERPVSLIRDCLDYPNIKVLSPSR